MKKHLLSLLVAVSIASTCYSQAPIRENQVPPAVKEDFAQRMQTAENVTWLQQGAEYYGARYQIGEHAGEVVYMPDGRWVQTSEEMSYRDLPDPARQYARENYPDYSAHEVKKLSTRNYGILYKLRIRRELKQVSMTFDMHGKLIEETEENLEPEKKGGLKGLLRR